MIQPPQMPPIGGGHGNSGQLWDATIPGGGAATIFMALVIAFVLGSVTSFFLYLRWRARNPLENPSDSTDMDFSGQDKENQPDWERSSDWWQKEEDTDQS